MSKFTAAQLVEFYQKVADGGVMSLKKGFDDEPQNNYVGPNMTSPVEYWRIKPAKKIIDMAHFIESGIDMEFWDDASDSYTNISILDSINVGLNYAFVSKISRYKHCRPRMNHIHAWQGGECPLPEGFKVRLMFRDGAAVVTHTYSDLKWVSSEFKVFTHADIIGYEILGLADGWAYTWESDE